MKKGGAIFVTGATGALGPALLAELLGAGRPVVALTRPGRAVADERINVVEGDLTGFDEPPIDPREIDVIVHAAADTRFRAPREEQELVNVQGTQNVLAWARRQCVNLRRFVFVSTTCVAGTRTGSIAETIAPDQPEFVNFYEATKWHAEQLVVASGLPSIIVRLSTAIGDERDGAVRRLGAVHHALRWMYRGLVPMLPGRPDTPIDLISTDLAARCIARCATIDGPVPDVIHVAAGSRAVLLGELLDFVVEQFRRTSVPWRQGQFRPPLIVDRTTFELFKESIRQSGDVLFRTVLDSTSAFLPGLLHPKVYQTNRAESLLGGGPLPLPDWRELLGHVVFRCVQAEEARRG